MDPHPLPQIAAADEAEHLALLWLHTLDEHSPGADPAPWLEDYLIAANDYNGVLVSSWNAVPQIAEATAYVADDPLLLAFDLQGELRRRLGPNNHTTVAGLEDDHGCVGDIVQDRLVMRFGEVLLTTSTAKLGTSAHPTVYVLNRFAFQVACLGSRQLAEFEHALTRGFDMVASRMRFQGRHDLVGPFARMVAPLQLIVLDARKHVGSYSESWRWFRSYGTELEEVISRAGWASGDVMVWHRRSGLLVGYPDCALTSGDCVDLETLMDTVRDPRALGSGSCGFPFMIESGITQFDDTSTAGGSVDPAQGAGGRYVCPERDCEEDGSLPVGGMSSNELADLQQRWSSITVEDADQQTVVCRGSFANVGGTPASQADCVDTEFATSLEGQNDPFDQFLACTAEAAGAGQMPEVGAHHWMTGVPQGTTCSLASEGTTTATSANPHGKLSEGEARKTRQDDGNYNWQYRSKERTVNGIKKGGAIYNAISGKVTFAASNGVVTYVAGDCDGCSATDKESFAKEFIYQQVLASEGEDAANAASSPLGRLVNVSTTGTVFTYEGTTTVYEHVPGFAGSETCFDPWSCDNDCSSLSRQMTHARVCSEDYMTELAAALGRPRHELTNRLDFVSYPRPNGATIDDNIGVCLQTAAGRGNPGCGLIICEDGLVARTAGDDCTCAPGATGMVAQSTLCAQIRCSDGVQVNQATCECDQAEEVPNVLPGFGGPLPLRVNGLQRRSHCIPLWRRVSLEIRRSGRRRTIIRVTRRSFRVRTARVPGGGDQNDDGRINWVVGFDVGSAVVKSAAETRPSETRRGDPIGAGHLPRARANSVLCDCNG